jgi:hypothetical protein
MSNAHFRARGVGRYASALDAAAATLVPRDGNTSFEAARAALAHRFKGLSSVQIQECLGADGIKVSADFAARLQVDAIQQLEHGELAGRQPHHEHAVRDNPLDGAGLHVRSLGEAVADECDHWPKGGAA